MNCKIVINSTPVQIRVALLEDGELREAVAGSALTAETFLSEAERNLEEFRDSEVHTAAFGRLEQIARIRDARIRREASFVCSEVRA